MLKEIIASSKKVIVFDADYDNRSHVFLSHFGQVNVIINEKIKNVKHFKYTNDVNLFKKLIYKDILNGLNICVAAMSTGLIEEIYNYLIEKGIKIVLYTSKCSKEVRDELGDVNKHWPKYQCILSSPMVESGIDFNKKHFHKIYAILSSNTNSARAFLQQCGRVRDVESNEIITYFDKKQLQFNEYAPVYTYKEIKDYFAYLYNGDDVKKIIVKIDNGEKMLVNQVNDLFSKIMIYNQIEESNRSRNYFIPTLIKLCKQKGHTFEPLELTDETKLMTIEEKPKKKDAIEADKIKILNAKDVIKKDIDDLIKKKNKNETSVDEIYMIEKYMIKNFWNIDEISQEFLDCFYRKEYILTNLKALIDHDNIKEDDPIKKTELLLKCKIIDDLICMLGFANVDGGQTVLTSEQLKTNMDKILNSSLFFKNFDKNRLLFGMEKAKNHMFKEWNIKIFVKSINVVFQKFGLKLNSFKKRIRQGKILKLKIIYAFGNLFDIDKFINFDQLFNKYSITPESYIINNNLFNIL